MKLGEIKQLVGDYYNVDLMGESKMREQVRPRQVFHYLCRKHTSASLCKIALQTGTKDHTTVYSNIKKITELREKDRQINEDVIILSRLIEGVRK